MLLLQVRQNILDNFVHFWTLEIFVNFHVPWVPEGFYLQIAASFDVMADRSSHSRLRCSHFTEDYGVTCNVYFQFILEGVTLEGSQGDIAVDDVTVLEESCHTSTEWSNLISLAWFHHNDFWSNIRKRKVRGGNGYCDWCKMRSGSPEHLDQGKHHTNSLDFEHDLPMLSQSIASHLLTRTCMFPYL